MIEIPENLGVIRRIGLTGSMGTGKSTAAEFFRLQGVQVIDADHLARKVVEPGRPALKELTDYFGDGVLDAQGQLDRRKLAGLVFLNPESRKRLEEILHPRIAQEAEAEMSRLLDLDPDGVIVYDIPLLFETGAEGKFDLLVTVYAPRNAQVERAAKRAGITQEEVKARLATQMDIEEKVRRSHVWLDNSTTPEELGSRVAELLDALTTHNKNVKS